MDNSANKFPKPLYDKLKNETQYKCDGSSCSCRFLKNRSNYDQMQYEVYELGQKVFLPSLNNGNKKNIWPM